MSTCAGGTRALRRMGQIVMVAAALCCPGRPAFAADAGFADDFQNLETTGNGVPSNRWTSSETEDAADPSWSAGFDSARSVFCVRATRNSNRGTALYLTSGYSLPEAWKLEIDLKWIAPLGLDDANGGQFGIRLGDQTSGPVSDLGLYVVLERRTLANNEAGVVLTVGSGRVESMEKSEVLAGNASLYHLTIERTPGSDELQIHLRDEFGTSVSMVSAPIYHFEQLTIPALYAYGVVAEFSGFSISAPGTQEEK